jgi:hypothetical protein
LPPAAKPSRLPPSLVAGELSSLRLQADRLGLEKPDERSTSAGHRHRRAEATNKPAVETSGEPALSSAANTDRLRPAALRTIDEGDPYR